MNIAGIHKRALTGLLLAASLVVATSVQAQSEAELQLLEQVRSGQTANRVESQRALAAFRGASDLRQRELLEQARARAAALQAESQRLEVLARDNKRAFDARILDLAEAGGAGRGNAGGPGEHPQPADGRGFGDVRRHAGPGHRAPVGPLARQGGGPLRLRGHPQRAETRPEDG